MKDFFSKSGITSTDANFYANLAQEKIQNKLKQIESMSFVNTYVQVVGTNGKLLMSKGVHKYNIDEVIKNITEANSLCAWLREAIKYKDQLLKEAEQELNKTYEVPCPEPPVRPTPLTEDDIIAQMDSNEYYKYLALESAAATYGKIIHPKRPFSIARQDLLDKVNNPISKEGTGTDTTLYYYEETVNPDEIEDYFEKLQNDYRAFEKELNNMKAIIKDRLAKANIDLEEEYKKAYAKYHQEYVDWTKAGSDFYCNQKEKVINEKDRISKLKIKIPTDLQDIFNKISK
jgi:archaellum component FlaC